MITKEMKLAEVIARWPELGEIFFDFGMGCVGCPSAVFESIEEGALTHGFTEEEINEMVDKLNETISKKND